MAGLELLADVRRLNETAGDIETDAILDDFGRTLEMEDGADGLRVT